MEIDIDMDFDEKINYLEGENYNLSQQIKQLESALDKQKKYHRKFVEDVIQSEEIRNKDFDKERKELVDDRKRLITENRVLAKDKSFYQTAYDALMAENNSNHSSKSSGQLVRATFRSYNTRSSINSLSTPEPSSLSSVQHRSSKVISKASEKLFEENKKLKLKIMKLTKDNALLRSKHAQLENFKKKMENKKLQQEMEENELKNLIQSTKRTNTQIFNADVLSKLGRLSRN